jgi:hypothetical protein
MINEKQKQENLDENQNNDKFILIAIWMIWHLKFAIDRSNADLYL